MVDEIPQPPSVEIQLERPPRRTEQSSEPGLLVLRFSDPADDDLAFVSVVFRWSESGFRSVYVGRPQTEIEILVDGLGGGRECQVFVTYSNGLRSAAAVSEPFPLHELGPTVTMLRPRDGDEVIARTPVALAGFTEHPEHPGVSARADDLLVWLVNGEEAAHGPSTSVDGLPGRKHEITLVYRAAVGRDSTAAQTSVTVIATDTVEPTANDWADWDPVNLT